MDESRGRSNHKTRESDLTRLECFFWGHMGIAMLYLTTFPLTGDSLLVWRLFWLAPVPLSPACFLNWNQCSSPFILTADCLNQARVYQAPPDWHFPLAAAPTGDSITDSAPLGMDNPRLKPPDSVINDMSTACDPCSLAAMPHVEPWELWRADKGDLYNYALAQQSSPLANIDRAWQDLY